MALARPTPPHAAPADAAPALPHPLIPGEHVEIWLDPASFQDHAPTPGEGATGAGDTGSAEGAGRANEHWAIASARIVAITPELIILRAARERDNVECGPTGAPTRVRRVSPEGIAEWDGTISERETPDGLDYATLGALHTSPETVVMVRVQPGAGAGRLVQRRRSQRVPLGGIPASAALTGAAATAGAPLAIEADAETIAQLTDVSVHGAGVLLNSPLPGGATVALRFELPGEDAPFSLRGRVVEPAGESSAGSGGFRRGVEFIGTAANGEVRRLAAAVTRLLGSRQGSPAAGAPAANPPAANSPAAD